MLVLVTNFFREKCLPFEEGLPMKIACSVLMVCAGVAAACSTSVMESGQVPDKPAPGHSAGYSSAKTPATAATPGGQADATAVPVEATPEVAAAAPVAAPGTAPAPVVAASSSATPTAAAPAPASADNVVTFHIPAGTGSKAWNSAQTPISLQAGQTLQVVNDDSVDHWIHTDGFAPFFHPLAGIAPGASATYKANSKFSGTVHDHLRSGMIYFGDK